MHVMDYTKPIELVRRDGDFKTEDEIHAYGIERYRRNRRFPMAICQDCSDLKCGGQCKKSHMSPVNMKACPDNKWSRIL